MPSPRSSVTSAGPARSKTHASGVRGWSRASGSRQTADCGASNGSACGPCPVMSTTGATADSRAATCRVTASGSSTSRYEPGARCSIVSPNGPVRVTGQPSASSIRPCHAAPRLATSNRYCSPGPPMRTGNATAAPAGNVARTLPPGTSVAPATIGAGATDKPRCPADCSAVTSTL